MAGESVGAVDVCCRPGHRSPQPGTSPPGREVRSDPVEVSPQSASTDRHSVAQSPGETGQELQRGHSLLCWASVRSREPGVMISTVRVVCCNVSNKYIDIVNVLKYNIVLTGSQSG